MQTIASKLRRFLDGPYAWLIPIAVSLIGAGLYLYRIDAWGIWFDEAYSVFISHQSWGDIIRFTSIDLHPPLYYFVLKVWMSWFGDSDTAIRTLSAVCMAGALGIGYSLVKRLCGSKIALGVIPFLLLSPMLLRYAQEARMYAMITLICIAATYVLVRATQQPNKSLIWWMLYALLIIAGLYTHYYTALIWLVHWIWWVYNSWQAAPLFRHKFKAFFRWQWLTVYAVSAVAFLPWLPIMRKQYQVVQDYGFWIKPLDHTQILNVASAIFFYRPIEWVSGWSSVLLLLVIGISIYLIAKAKNHFSDSKKTGLILLALYIIVPFIIILLISLPPRSSVFTERYFSFISISFSALLGASATVLWLRKNTRILAGVLSLILLVTFAGGMYNAYTIGKVNFSNLRYPYARELMQHAATTPRVPVISEPYIFYETSHYASTSLPVYFYNNNRFIYRYGSMTMMQGSPWGVTDLIAFGQKHPQVWYFYLDDVQTAMPANWKKLQQYDRNEFHATLYSTQQNLAVNR
ncbi:MAG TPA: glycosyltransferase family 39 protein [Candidatus Saccharimonadales bacterium]|jgi:4-amino-4-deoxy-L-arabinose transferase-like glycosyltransferase|nr:glycosyltransferase family 39 protein [Candidatus Saccharimonadales bacterium]